MRYDLHESRSRLIHAFKRWDVELRLVKGEVPKQLDYSNRAFKIAPSNDGGILWEPGKRPVVIWPIKESKSFANLCALIHELGHILLWIDPHKSDEIDSAMLAIEASHHAYCLIPQRGVDLWMRYFSMPSGNDWPDASWTERLDILSASRKVAFRQKLIDKEGHPTFTWTHGGEVIPS